MALRLRAAGYTPAFSRRAHGYTTCGYVNSRNRMGGYVGRTAFAVVVDYDIIQVLDIGSSGGVSLVEMACLKAGFPAAATMASSGSSSSNANTAGSNGFAFRLTAVPDGAYVATVVPGSSMAEKAGLRPGMVIQEVNGVALKNMGLGTVNQILSAASGPVTLTMVGGNSVQVTKEAGTAPPRKNNAAKPDLMI